VVAARATRRQSLTDVLWLRQRFISRILGPSGVCTQGGGEELLWFSVRIGLNETEGSQLRQRVILVLWMARVCSVYDSPRAMLRIRLAKRRFNKFVKSARTQLPVFYWAVGYIAISAFRRRQFSGPRGGSSLRRQDLPPSGTEGGGSSGCVLTNRRILRQRGVEGGCRRAASIPQKCKLWCYIIFL
jgi:hypothetical protein